MPRNPSASLLLGFVLAATAVGQTPNAPAGGAAEVVRYFLGRRETRLADGTVGPGTETAVKRNVRPDQGVVIDWIVDLDPAGGKSPVQYLVTYRLDKSNFSISESTKAFEGSLRPRGSTFDWQGYDADYVVRGGTTMSAKARQDGKRLRIDKTVKSAAGQILVTMVENLDVVDEAAWSKRLAEARVSLDAEKDRRAKMARNEFFHGRSRVRSPDGRELREIEVLLRRDFEPNLSRIVQHTLSIDPTGAVAPIQSVIDLQVDEAGKVSLEDRQRHLMKGSGQGKGPAWYWTGFDLRSEFADGTVMESREEYGEQKAVIVTRAMDRGAKVIYEVRMELDRITMADFAARTRAVFGDAEADPAARPTARYFSGASKVSDPDGKEVAEAQVLLQLVYARDGRSIRHYTVKIDPQGKAAPVALGLQLAVDGNAFTVSARGKSVTGSGRLSGPAGAWTRIDMETFLPDKTRLVSSDSLIATDRLSSQKQLYKPDGSLAFRFSEELKEVSASDWQRALTLANLR